jgi:hypothetical protein
MLNRYSPNSRKLNRVYVPPRISNNDLTGSLSDIVEPNQKNYSISKKNDFSKIPIVNTKSIQNSDLTGSLQNIEIPSEKTYNANTKSTSYTSKVINNENTIKEFENEIAEFSGMGIKKQIDSYDAVNSTFTIKNVLLEYGTEGVRPENFEIYVTGLKIPTTTYIIYQSENNVTIKFNQVLFDYADLQMESVIIIGKFLDIGLEQIDDIGLTDENGEFLIL